MTDLSELKEYLGKDNVPYQEHAAHGFIHIIRKGIGERARITTFHKDGRRKKNTSNFKKVYASKLGKPYMELRYGRVYIESRLGIDTELLGHRS